MHFDDFKIRLTNKSAVKMIFFYAHTKQLGFCTYYTFSF
ncbi:hypothetical protein NTHI1209_00023 [Haemophilus influenzae]|uniref:Uncharacterized protein n=1 Tax=Haemophilus influenzae TaxID=727 RepID=A0A158T0G5_HAEIF|nr:hypothetical protein NTHI1209_00023 [Haemophilus influenzae]